MAKKPCIGCVYFDTCGSTTRTESCVGRKTKTEKKMEQKIVFTTKELELAKELAYKNMENDSTEIGFEHCGQWITNPFMDVSGRFEFTDLDAMCQYYGKSNVYGFITQIMEGK